MFDFEIIRVRSSPMALQRHPHGSIIHLNLPAALPAILSGPLNSWCCTLFRNAGRYFDRTSRVSPHNADDCGFF
jgi:hypothetical protein